MRILVTGGAGFIASHISDGYITAGHDVLIVDNFDPHGGAKREYINPKAEFVEIDIRSESLNGVFEKFKPDVVSHHAAQHSVAVSNREPLMDADINVMGLLRVLEAASACGTRKIIYASSGATFGTVEKLPITESTPQRPTSPYGASKLVGEHYLHIYNVQRGLDYTAFRYANVYGPRQNPFGEGGVVAIFTGRFLGGQPVRIDSDGNQTRDFTFVGDIAQLNLAALDKGSCGRFCIGTGTPTSINTLYTEFVAASGIEPPIERAAKRPGDAQDTLMDPALAIQTFGWRPEIKLREGISRTLAFYRERLPSPPK
jgi:UDP-glucose 4-epimerase